MSESGSTDKKIFGERYAIESKIARGGMADVYLARDQLLDRPVALKVLFAELSVDPSFVERFRREAQNAARLSHPNIVSVYDWGEDGNTYYIVMEFVDGNSLSSLLRENGPLPAERAALVGSDVASALAFAHQNGVVHRDVKPGNVLIDDRGSVKVTDFGIARARNTTENLTQTGAVMGTATYFSPEQAQGLAVDQRSDVYSLGVVLYEIVAGKPPFQGDNPVTIAYKHVREQPVPLRRINPEVPPAYEAIVGEAMAKSPANRYSSADELRDDLERFRRGQAVRATAVAPPISPTAVPRRQVEDAYGENVRAVAAPVRPAPPQPLPRLPKDNKGVLGPFLVFLAILAVLGLGAILVFTDNVLTKNNDGEPKVVQLPNLVGKTVTDAQNELEALKLESRISRQPHDTEEANVVFAQNPGAGATAREGNTIDLTVSEGQPQIPLPNVVDQQADQATTGLEKLGLKVVKTQASSDTVASGKVIEQEPRQGASVSKGQTVTLTVSTGAQQTEVPMIIGLNESSAKQLLTDAGLEVNAVNVNTDAAEGNVVASEPAVGTKVARGSTVLIYVSTGDAPSDTTTSSTPATTVTTKKPKD